MNAFQVPPGTRLTGSDLSLLILHSVELRLAKGQLSLNGPCDPADEIKTSQEGNEHQQAFALFRKFVRGWICGVR